MNLITPLIENIHYSKDLESAILGICLLEKDSFGRTYGIIDKENFYFDGHKEVYDAIAEMYNNGIPIDLLTVTDYLMNDKKKIEINSLNTAYFLVRLTNSVASSAHLEYHCFIIKRMWMEREVLKITHGSVKLEGDVKAQIQQLSQSIQYINQGVYQKEWFSMDELIYNLTKHQDEMKNHEGKGVTTGIKTLDRENGGFFGGQMIVLGARPSVGKSAFIGKVALAMAKQNKRVGIVSLEMKNNEIAARLSALETIEDFKVIFRNLFRDEDQRANWYDRVSRMTNLPIYVSDKSQVTTTDIRSKAIKLKHQHGLDCLIIDYLQLISGDENNKNRNRENEVSQISRTCKLIAMDMNIPVIVLCQLNRQVTQRKGINRYPQLSDLRESGSIEQDADVVMFLHRDWMSGEEYMTDEDGHSTENQADLVIRKWRNGASNLHIKLGFDAPRMMFLEEREMHTIAPERNEAMDDFTNRYNSDQPF